MNWPSYLEDINDRALALPPSYRRAAREGRHFIQRMDTATPRKPRPQQPFMDGATAKWLKELRARRADEIEADRLAKRLREEKLAAAKEARKRRDEVDARDWQQAIAGVEPLKRR